MAANANTRATFNISATVQYKSGTSAANIPGSLGPRTVSIDVTTVTKSYVGLLINVPAGTSYTLDVGSFVDNLLAAATWTKLTYLCIEHNAASLAVLGIDLTGAAADAIPSLRGSKLLPGEGCIPFYNTATGGSGTAGFTITSPTSRLVIANLDPVHDATIDILLMGN